MSGKGQSEALCQEFEPDRKYRTMGVAGTVPAFAASKKANCSVTNVAVEAA